MSEMTWNSLLVQWLGLSTSTAWVELRSQLLRGMAKKKKN